MKYPSSLRGPGSKHCSGCTPSARGGHSPWWGAPRHTTKFGRGGMGLKPHKLKGCQGLNNFLTRLEVTTEVTNSVRVTPMSPGCMFRLILFRENCSSIMLTKIARIKSPQELYRAQTVVPSGWYWFDYETIASFTPIR